MKSPERFSHKRELTEASTKFTSSQNNIFSPQKATHYSFNKTFTPKSSNEKMPKTKIFLNSPIKKLNDWDREHIKTKKEDPLSLYYTLTNFYKKRKLNRKQKELDSLYTLLKSKSNVNSLFKKGAKTNKIIEEFYQRKNKEQGSILRNNIIKTKNKFNFSLSTEKTQKDIQSEFNIDKDTIKAMKRSEINNDYYRVVIKEKIKYENQLHDELLKLSYDIFEKKEFKEKIENKITKLYEEKVDLIKKLTEKKNAFKMQKANLDLEYWKGLKNVKGMYDKTEEAVYKTIEMKFNISKLSKNNYIDQQLKELEAKFQKEVDEINRKKEEANENLKAIEEEIDFSKQVCDEFMKEQKDYYYNILEKGYDSRGEGITWAVKRLLELDARLDYYHFPKFLSHEQVDYIMKISQISLEEMQYNIILKALKGRQLKLKVDENMKRFVQVDDFINEKSKEKGGIAVEREEQYDEGISKTVKREIDLRFNKLVNKHEDAFHLFAEKRIEEHKMEILSYQIRQTLLGKNVGTTDHDNVLKFFLEHDNHKQLFNMILSVRKKLKTLDEEKQRLRKEQIQIFHLNERTTNVNKNVKSSMQNELVKACLFGTNDQI